MLDERPARAMTYDAKNDLARIDVGPTSSITRTYPVALLLDGEGFLVAVELPAKSFGRLLVMLGPHERVAQRKEARAIVAEGADGEPAEVRIANAAATIRANEPSPYL